MTPSCRSAARGVRGGGHGGGEVRDERVAHPSIVPGGELALQPSARVLPQPGLEVPGLLGDVRPGGGRSDPTPMRRRRGWRRRDRRRCQGKGQLRGLRAGEHERGNRRPAAAPATASAGRAGRARISVARCAGSGGRPSVSASEATGASSRASAAAVGGLSSGRSDRHAVTAATSSGGRRERGRRGREVRSPPPSRAPTASPPSAKALPSAARRARRRPRRCPRPR